MLKFRLHLFLCLLCLLIALTWGPGFISHISAASTHTKYIPPSPSPPCTQIIVSGVLDGNWEILAINATSRQLLNLTHSPEDERDPSISPDGQWIAFSAHYNRNWDIYKLHLLSGELQRLTSSPAYDGYPTWSPDGSRIAFESNRLGNLDIFRMPASGGEATRITSDAAADVEPAWTADGRSLVFSSWRSHYRQLYQVDLETGSVAALTEAGDEARQPTLSPDGQYLAYVVTRDDAARVLVRSLASGATTPLTGDYHFEWPIWQPATRQGTLPDVPTLLCLRLTGGGDYSYPTGWVVAASQVTPMDIHPDLTNPASGLSLPGQQWQRPVCASFPISQGRSAWRPIAEATRHPPVIPRPGLTTLPDVYALQPRLSLAVVPSYQQLRERIFRASGYDFLSELYDAWRGLDHPASAYLSWHMAGRAIDVRNRYRRNKVRILYTSRQVLGGQTYFRLYLQAAAQDGSQGQPLRESLWETDRWYAGAQTFDEDIRRIPPIDGYFVDFTDLAEREGWMRIAALSPPDGDWKHDYMDQEFWHYERRDGLTWYTAMRQIFRDAELRKRYTPGQILAHGYSLAQMIRAGIPGTAQILMDGMSCAQAAEQDVQCQPALPQPSNE